MKSINEYFAEIQAKEAEEKYGPAPDIAICSDCGGRFKTGEYDLEWESEGWEHPEYQVPYCRKCKDGGCIDDWDFSPEQKARFNKWEVLNEKENPNK